MTAPRVLAVTYGGGHIAMVLPVMRALRERSPGLHIDLITMTTAYAAAKSAGEPALRYADLLHLVDAPRALAYGRALLTGAVHPQVGEEESVAYLGVNYLDMVLQHGEDKAAQLYKEHGRYGFRPVNFFEAVLAHFKPQLILTTNSPRSEEAVIEAGLAQGIPTVSMVDLFVAPRDPYRKRAHFADAITVLDERVRQVLVDVGVPAQAVHATGNPAFDGLRSPQRHADARAFIEARGWQGKQVVLWAGHVDDYSSSNVDMAQATAYPRAVEARLMDWVNEREDRALIVRYHPNETQHFPQGPEHPRVFRSTTRQHVHEAILAADVVVVQMSTVGLEAATAGKPVVALFNSPSARDFNFNYETLGVAYGCPEIADLPAVMEQAAARGCAYKASGLPPAAPAIAGIALGLLRPRA